METGKGSDALRDEITELNEDELEQVAGGKSVSQGGSFTCSGIVVGCLPNGSFTVELENGSRIEANISGKLRLNYIKIIVGDRVTVQMSDEDTTKGRIIFRDNTNIQ